MLSVLLQISLLFLLWSTNLTPDQQSSAILSDNCPDDVDYLQQAEAFVDQYNYREAITSYTCALAQHPDQAARILGARANAYFKTHNMAKAIADLSQFIELTPPIAGSFALRSHYYWMNSDYENAIADLNRAIDLDEWNFGYYYLLGLYQLDAGNIDLAVKAFNRTELLMPDFAPIFLGRAYAFHLKDWNGFAQINLDRYRATDKEGRTFDNLVDLALQAYHYENIHSAINLSSQIIFGDPNNAKGYYIRGISFSSIRDYLRAENDLQQAISIAPTEITDAYFRLIEIYTLQGNTAKVKEWTARLRSVLPTPVYIQPSGSA